MGFYDKSCMLVSAISGSFIMSAIATTIEQKHTLWP